MHIIDMDGKEGLRLNIYYAISDSSNFQSFSPPSPDGLVSSIAKNIFSLR